MLIVDKHSCDEFPQIDRKSKQEKEQWYEKNYLDQYGENLLFYAPKILKFGDE